MLQLRFDRGGLASPRPLPDGSVIYSGRAARTGEHEYPWGTERRDADELRRIAAQLVGVPVVTPHPSGMIRDGAAANVVGHVVSAEIDGDHVAIDFRVDVNGDAAIKSGASELSLGYSVASGRGEQHRGTVVDHVALVQSARCGPTCSVRTDEACPCAENVPGLTAGKNRAIFPQSNPLGDSMSDKNRNDELDKANETIATLETKLSAANQRADAATQRADSATEQVAALTKEIDALKSDDRTDAEKIAELEKKLAAETARADAAEDPARLSERVDARVKLETAALKAIGETDRECFDGKSDREVMVAVVEKHGATVGSDKSDDYVAARFDAIVEECQKRADEAGEDPEKQRSQEVAARVKLETSALAALGEKDRTRFDGKTDREVMVDVLKQLKVEIDDSKSDDYVAARFDAAVERYFSGSQALANLRQAADPSPGANARADATTARERMIDSNRNAWKRSAAKA